MRVGSLFSGIGGLELGLERAGMTTVWQVEKEEFCRKVLAKHWPEVRRYEDVREVGSHNLEPVDLICGGFPCQDISLAGKGLGIAEGTRSGLWSEYARIVRELRPRYVLVENVPALTSRGLDRVLGDLATLGYDAEWTCVSAGAFGAPHQRDRIFVFAHPNRERRGQEPFCEPRSVDQAVRAYDGSTRPVAGQMHPSWRIKPGVGRVVYGLPPSLDRLRALGNAVVPQVAEFIGRRIVEADR